MRERTRGEKKESEGWRKGKNSWKELGCEETRLHNGNTTVSLTPRNATSPNTLHREIAY